MTKKEVIGILKDLAVITEPVNPKVLTAQVKTKEGIKFLNWSHFSVSEQKGQFILSCNKIEENQLNNLMLLKLNGYYSRKNSKYIYKERWKIETFFKFIKQNLNIKRLFGTTENAVYNQFFISLIAYVLLQFTYVETTKNLKYVKLSLIQFIRKLLNNKLEVEVYVAINLFLNNSKNKLIA